MLFGYSIVIGKLAASEPSALLTLIEKGFLKLVPLIEGEGRIRSDSVTEAAFFRTQ